MQVLNLSRRPARALFIVLLLGLAIGLLWVSASAQGSTTPDNYKPDVPPPLGVDIWVDRGEGGIYYVGEPLEMCYDVDSPVYIRIWDCQPGMACRVILEGYDDGQGDCRRYTVTRPVGQEVLRIEAIVNDEVVAQAETWFWVFENEDPVSVNIWVDRGEGSVYKVGDPLRLCYSVSRPIYIKVYDCQPGQSCRVILEGNDDGRGDCRDYTVDPPTGWETVRIQAIENNQVVAQDETYFYVTDDVDTEPPAGYCHVRWVDVVSNTCSGEFGLDSPQRTPLFSDYKYRPSPDVVEFGPFNPDTSLTFYIRPWGSCGGEYLSTSANAHITDLGTNRWRIAWEDLPPSRADDYNDLIVEVECGLQTESCEDSYEPDDSYGEANWISVNGGGQTHRFCDAGDQDWLKFSATSGTEYSIQTYFLGSESDTYLYLYDTNGVTELAHDDDGAEESRASRITWTAPQNGTYYIMVRQYDQSEYGPDTNYDISVQGITYFSIAGWVTDDGGAPVSGATVSLTGPVNLSITSEPDGRYALYNLPAGTYSLSASKAGYTSPPTRDVTVPPNTDNVNFVLQRPRYSISGRVTESNNNPISGVTISAGADHTTITDSNGNYTLNGLLVGTYTLTPSKSEHTFSPASRTVSVPPSATGQDFIGATPSQGSRTICGEVRYLMPGCNTNLTYNVFFPCDTGSPETSMPYLLPSSGTTIPQPGFYRFYNPQSVADSFCIYGCGVITRRMIGWDSYESIGNSCDSCGGSLVECSPTGPADLRVGDFTWDPAPEAFKRTSLEVPIYNDGPGRYDPGEDGYYRLEVKFILPPLGDDWTFYFDSENEISARRLSLTKLPALDPATTFPDSSGVKITISDLMFPSGFTDGDVVVRLIPKHEDSNMNNNVRGPMPLSIAGPPVHTVLECWGAWGALVTAVGKEAIEDSAIKAVGTSLVQDTIIRVSSCLSNQDLECVKNEIWGMIQIPDWGANEIVSKLVSILKWLFNALVTETVEAPIECFLELFELVSEIVNYYHSHIGGGNMMTVASPVYILATNGQGQRVGFLDDGTPIQEIEGSEVIASDQIKFIYYSGDNTETIRVKGYDTGTFDLLFAISMGNTFSRVKYFDVPTNSSMVGFIDADDGRYIMTIDQDGDGSIDESRAPDGVSITWPNQLYLPFVANNP